MKGDNFPYLAINNLRGFMTDHAQKYWKKSYFFGIFLKFLPPALWGARRSQSEMTCFKSPFDRANLVCFATIPANKELEIRHFRYNTRR
jgi:hypothetical protein